MIQSAINYRLLDELTGKALFSEKKERIEKYILEVAEKCTKLCYKGESLKVMYEFKMMIENLCAELGI